MQGQTTDAAPTGWLRKPPYADERMFDGAGRPWMDRALDPYFRFDTQDPERKRQCLVDGDGSFQVRDSTGNVLVEHDFADRPVCEREELDVTDLELVWRSR